MRTKENPNIRSINLSTPSEKKNQCIVIEVCGWREYFDSQFTMKSPQIDNLTETHNPHHFW